MKLEWMGPHRQFIEKFFRCINIYTRMYKRPADYGGSNNISASQIQTLEYILEGEDQKMSEIAARLGITRGAFSKNVQKLVERGFLEKLKRTDNQKDIYLFVTEEGKKFYRQYSDYVSDLWLKEVFGIIDQISPEDLERFEYILDGFSESFLQTGQIGGYSRTARNTGEKRKKPVYRPIK